MRRPAVLPLAITLSAAALVLSVASPVARAASSYDACTGFITSIPAVITTQGIWCLDGDLASASASGAAIQIAGNNITIDCNGFKIGGLAAGLGTEAVGINASARTNLTVRDCAIRGFSSGVMLIGGSGHLLEDNRFDGNTLYGAFVTGEQSLARRNRIFDTGGSTVYNTATGLWISGDAIDNIVDGVDGDGSFAAGIRLVSNGSVARGNRVRGLSGGSSHIGIYALNAGSSIDGNVVVDTIGVNGTGIEGAGASASFCSGNHVYGFGGDAIGLCHEVEGNAAL